MARISSKDIGLFCAGGWRLLGFSTQFTLNIELGTERADVLGDSWVYNDTTKLLTATLTQNGFFTTEAAGSNAAFAAMQASGVRQGATLALANPATPSTAGVRAWVFVGALSSTFNITATRGELAKAEGAFVSTGQTRLGWLLANEASIGQGGHTTAEAVKVNESGVTSDNGGIASVNVMNYNPDGATGLVVTIEEADASETLWTTILTFDAITADNTSLGAEVLAVTVGPKMRAIATWSGTAGAAATADLVVSFARNPSIPV